MPTPKDTAAAYIADAREFIDAVALLRARASIDSLPCYFMLGRAIELALKAFLMLQGQKPWTLSSRQYGHDLTALLERTIAKNLYRRLRLEPIDAKSVDLLNREYVCTRLSYRASGQWHRLPVFERTVAVAESLVAAMEVHLADLSDA